VNNRGNPWVKISYPYPYPPKPIPSTGVWVLEGMGEGYKGYEGYAIPPVYEWSHINMDASANHTGHTLHLI
jgi:hypothetical protein